MKRAYYIIKLTMMWIWYHIFRKKRTRTKPLNEWFFRSMESACANGRLAVDFEKCIVQMTTQFYADFLCNGAYTPMNDFKAHMFFEDMRQWMNVRRGYLNGAYNMGLEEVKNDDPVKFGVTDGEGKVYLIGYETVNHIVLTKTEEENDEGTAQEQDDDAVS